MEAHNQQSILGDDAWRLSVMLLSGFMVPGIGFVNSGLVRQKSALSMILLSFAAGALTFVEWYAVGYSLAFSKTSSTFIGDLRNAGLHGILGDNDPDDTKPLEILLFLRQAALASTSAALVTGATAERGSPWPCLIFIMLWNIFVYVPVTYWIWSPNGWLYKLGVIDCAGSTSAHICAGFASVVYSWSLGIRQGYDTGRVGVPHNIPLVILGTCFFGIGVTGVSISTLPSDISAVRAVLHICLAACMGGITWTSIDVFLIGKCSLLSVSSGIIVGLVAISSGAGFVPTWASLLYGIAAGAACNWATRIKYLSQIDDALDIFAFHAIGGVVGNMLTGIFAKKTVFFLGRSTDRFPDGSGWLDGHWMQPVFQLAAAVSAAGWSSLISFALLLALELLRQRLEALGWQRSAKIIRLRVSEKHEKLGIDQSYVGDAAYDDAEDDTHDEEDLETASLAEEVLSESRTNLLPASMVSRHPENSVDMEMTSMSTGMRQTRMSG